MAERFNICENVGRRINAVRTLRGLSIDELAQLAGKSAQYIIELENGELDADVLTMCRIAEILELELFELFSA